ncbi:MAG: NADH-quinone oxidoreductase subunit J family protein [Candidatus Aminicenantales bacterium]
MAWFIFLFLSVLCVGSVAAMIISRNQAHNALFLVLAFASLGGVFGLLDAPFVAVVQVIIYAGAIMVLFLFAIMMINLNEGLPPERKKIVYVISAVLAAVLAVELFLVARRAFLPGVEVAPPGSGSPAGIGRLLFTDYLYPFEITSLLLIAALIGAMTLSGKKESS